MYSPVKLKAFQETTEWDGNFPNHIYILNESKSKMYAYIKKGTKNIFKFKSPIDFSTKGRKFVELKQYKIPYRQEEPTGREWTVKGSKGNSYVVSEQDGKLKCTCSGFTFRGQCKHLEMVEI